MPRTVSEDKCVKRAEAARGKLTTLKVGGSTLKSPSYTGVAGAAPYNRRKGK